MFLSCGPPNDIISLFSPRLKFADPWVRIRVRVRVRVSTRWASHVEIACFPVLERNCGNV